MKIIKGLEEGQVLQRLGSRGATVQISGETSERGPILASISGPKGTLKGWRVRPVGQGARGKFSGTLSGIPAGGPYRLELKGGKEKLSLRAFFVGDVWVMAGQSNMEGSGNRTGAAKPHPLVRAFSMRHEWRLATDPLHILGESPDVCHNGGAQFSPELGEKARRDAVKGVGAGIFFGREMLNRSGVPQGLIATAHGGTSMTQWDPNAKDCMYQSMLQSVRATGQPVAGVLWYQGESETNPENVTPYTERMKKLVAATRRDFRLPNLPWVIVQLSHFYENREDVSTWNRIQEQQRLLPDKIKNLETISSIDLPLDDAIHIGAAGYPTLGLRLAEAASQLVYGGKKRPPQLRKAIPGRSPVGDYIDVSFDSVEKGLRAEGAANGFALVDSDGKDLAAVFKVTLHGNVARLHCSTPPAGASLFYGYGMFPYCNISDGRGLALPVLGPILLSKRVAMLPFVRTWKVTGIVTTDVPLGKLACPDVDAFENTVKTYGTHAGEGFINEVDSWRSRSGQGYFASSLTLEEPMKLRFLMGYDGPFRLWVDGKPLFQNLKGINPCFADESKKSISLGAGVHRITVAMDLNGGLAWGFFLRFIREDVSAAQIEEKNYLGPSYSV
jgi:hypothetical protein